MYIQKYFITQVHNSKTERITLLCKVPFRAYLKIIVRCPIDLLINFERKVTKRYARIHFVNIFGFHDFKEDLNF